MSTSDGTASGLAKVMMPVPDPHPDVFDIEWPLRVADVDREGRLKFDAATPPIQATRSDPPPPAHPGHRLRSAPRDGVRGDAPAVDRASHHGRFDRAHRVQGHVAASSL